MTPFTQDDFRWWVIEAGHGEYRRDQRYPRAFTQLEIDEACDEAVDRFNKFYDKTGSYFQASWALYCDTCVHPLPHGARCLNGTNGMRIELIFPQSAGDHM